MKKIIITISIVVLIFISINSIKLIMSKMNSDIINDLNGEIYYEKRVDGVSTLFKSDADLSNEQLVYSHIGKGKTSNGDNDNIIDYYYDSSNDKIDLIAMNDGEWSLFTLIDEELNFQREEHKIHTDYIKNSIGNISVNQIQGSLYLSENGEEKCIKKFYGIYDEKLTGYRPLGLSPDGKYLIYYTSGHLTILGTFIEDIFSNNVRETYIMDLKTGKSTRYKDIYNIQWLID